jgi:hypothetical protein
MMRARLGHRQPPVPAGRFEIPVGGFKRERQRFQGSDMEECLGKKQIKISTVSLPIIRAFSV